MNVNYTLSFIISFSTPLCCYGVEAFCEVAIEVGRNREKINNS